MFKINNKDTRTTPKGVVLLSSSSTLNILHTLFKSSVSIVNFEFGGKRKETVVVNKRNTKGF